MRVVGDEAELLALWERVRGLRPGARALALAAAFDPETDHASRPLGLRDAALLRFRGALFGPLLPVQARCDACSEAVEFSLAIDSLLQASHGVRSEGTLSLDGRAWRVRVPTAGDLARATSPEALLRACVPDATLAELEMSGFMEAFDAVVLDLDPAAELEIEVECGACGERWSDTLDVCTHLWVELDRSVRRSLSAVVSLARAFGWREADILAMSAERRAFYLAEIGA